MSAPKSRRRRSTGNQPEEPILVDDHTGIVRPTSPLERDPRSPKSWKRRDSDGVGLGILAALEREPPARLIVGNRSRVATKLDVRWSRRCNSDDGASSHVIIAKDGGEMGFDCASPPPPFIIGGGSDFRTADFLSYCYLCRKRLHGKDIYMYRGEKAFCSMECRYQQIVSDECHEKCASEVSASPYSGGRLFFTGVTAA